MDSDVLKKIEREVYTPAHIFRLIFSWGTINKILLLFLLPKEENPKEWSLLLNALSKKEMKTILTYSSQRIESHKNMCKASPFE